MSFTDPCPSTSLKSGSLYLLMVSVRPSKTYVDQRVKPFFKLVLRSLYDYNILVQFLFVQQTLSIASMKDDACYFMSGNACLNSSLKWVGRIILIRNIKQLKSDNIFFKQYIQQTINSNKDKTGVINDPLGHTHSHASSKHCFL